MTCQAARNRQPLCQEPSEHPSDAPSLRPVLPCRRVDTEGAVRHIPPLTSGDPRLFSQVKSGRCQQGSRIVSAAFAGLRERLACTACRAAMPLPAAVQRPSAMVV